MCTDKRPAAAPEVSGVDAMTQKPYSGADRGFGWGWGDPLGQLITTPGRFSSCYALLATTLFSFTCSAPIAKIGCTDL